jgi:hypothetical protein
VGEDDAVEEEDRELRLSLVVLVASVVEADALVSVAVVVEVDVLVVLGDEEEAPLLEDPVGVSEPAVELPDPVDRVRVKYGRVYEGEVTVSVSGTVTVAVPEPVSVAVALLRSVDCSCLCWTLLAWAREVPKRATRAVDLRLICIVGGFRAISSQKP